MHGMVEFVHDEIRHWQAGFAQTSIHAMTVAMCSVQARGLACQFDTECSCDLFFGAPLGVVSMPFLGDGL